MENSASEHVAANVRRLRQDRGWSLKEMSERLASVGHPRSVPVLSKMELGDRGIDVDDLFSFSVIFEVPVARLMGDPVLARSETAIDLVEAWREAVAEGIALRQRATAVERERREVISRKFRTVVADDPEVREAAIRHLQSIFHDEATSAWPERIVESLLGEGQD